MRADDDSIAARKSASSEFPCELRFLKQLLAPTRKKSNMTNKV